MKKPNGNDRPIQILALVTALCLLGDSMLYIVLPVYWKEFGLTQIWQIGVLLSVNRFVRLPLGPAVGWCYNRMGLRTGILLSIGITAVSTGMFAFVREFWWLLLARCLWGLAWSFLRLGGYLTVMSHSSDDNRGQKMGLYNGLWGLGSLAGMLAGGILTEHAGIAPLGVTFTIAALLGIPLTLLALPAVPPHASFTANMAGDQVRQMHPHQKSHTLRLLGITALVSVVYFGLVPSTLSLYIAEHQPDPLVVAGWTLGAASLSGLLQAARWCWNPLLSPWIGRLSDRGTSRNPLFMASLLCAGFLFLLAPLPLPVAVLLMLLVGLLLGNTLIMSLLDTIAGDAASRYGAVRFMTAYTLVIDLGAAAGPAAAYAVIGLFGVDTVYSLAAVILMLAAMVWTKARRF
jgi:MFS transporter, DHA1 family, multidrug resistance protein